jgi:hypothetical protein
MLYKVTYNSSSMILKLALEISYDLKQNHWAGLSSDESLPTHRCSPTPINI